MKDKIVLVDENDFECDRCGTNTMAKEKPLSNYEIPLRCKKCGYQIIVTINLNR